MNLTGYSLSRKWFDFCFENPEKISPNHTALYFFAIEHCNRMGWKKKFGLPTEMTKEAIGIKSWHTYIKTFNDIAEWGFFIVLERSKNQYSSNIIALLNFDEALDESLDEAIKKHLSKHQQSLHQSNDSIYKLITDNLQLITDNEKEFCDLIKKLNDRKISGSINVPFENFWNLYEKKVGDKEKIEKKWNNLTNEDRIRIMEYVPKYKLSEPNKKYRKNPDTFFNQKAWNDEIIGDNKIKFKPNDSRYE